MSIPFCRRSRNIRRGSFSCLEIMRVFLTKPFFPVNFWDALSVKEQELYGALFSQFPLAATSENGVLALHGGLPELADLEEINRIERGR